MSASPIAESPIVRALLRTLLFAASIEAIFARLLTLPASSESLPWIGGLRESTGRAGDMMSWVALAVLVPSLLGVAHAALRFPAWPGRANSLAAVGSLALVALWLSGSLLPQAPLLAAAFGPVALVVNLAMLAGMYEARSDVAGRAFAVALAGSLLCMNVHALADLAGRASTLSLRPTVRDAVAGAGIWLFLAAGALAFPAFAPSAAESGGRMERAATLGLSAAPAFALILGAATQSPILQRLIEGLGAETGPPAAVVLRSGTAAAALFLVVLTGFRGIGRPDLRARAYGLFFLLLAGYPHLHGYEHMLAVLGVALVSASPPPRPSLSVGVRLEESLLKNV